MHYDTVDHSEFCCLRVLSNQKVYPMSCLGEEQLEKKTRVGGGVRPKGYQQLSHLLVLSNSVFCITSTSVPLEAIYAEWCITKAHK